uniref:TrkA C-terminal domain-containing protein n=1 Tax=Sulfurimonas sp. TaxID=2022749 RepID=UPI0026086B9D
PYEVEKFDLSDEWKGIDEDINIEESIAFCVLQDMAENIFLTISLRSNFADLAIIAVALNRESANKLSMAGANKVIPLVETTADIITNMLEKPISSKILNNIIYEESDLKIAQIKIDTESKLENHKLASIDWTQYHGIIILSLIHEDMKSEFFYSKKMKEYIIQSGDILVVVGYENDITAFEKIIGSKRYVNWSHWRG